jgi:tubulin-specific chaperone A
VARFNIFQRLAIDETKAVFPPLRERIADALQKLQDRLESGNATEAETTKANEVIKMAEEAVSVK